MKKSRSLFALLLLGSLVLSGCGDKGKDTIPGDNTQQGGGDQGGSSGGSSSGGSGGGSQGGGGQQGGEGGGQQGGGGEGGGELPQNSRFVNKKFIVDTVETQPQVAQMETGYANAYISLFQDSSCELVAPHDDTYDVLFGTYGVNEADNLATMSIKKSFDGLEQLYSWALPTALRTLSLHYLSETDRFQVNMSFTYPATTMTLTLRALPNPPMHIVGDGVPQDPNGDSFNEQYQVEQYRYDQFLGDLSYSTRNLTVNAIVPHLWLVDESEEYVVEQQGNKFHLNYPGYPDSEAYYEVVNEVRDEQGALQSLRVDAYSHAGGEWHLAANQVYDPDFFQIIQGFIPVHFLETTYVGSENARHYFASNTSYLDYSGVTDPTRYQITNFRAAFENNNLKSVSYKQDARDYSFTVSKYNQTTIELPDLSDPSPEDYYSNIENKVFVFSEASGSGLSNPSDKAFVEALYESATLSLFANQNKDAELHLYKTTNDGVNAIDGESILYGTYNLSQLDGTYAKGGFTFVGFLEDGVYQTATGWYSMWYKIETSQIRISLGGNQFLWFNVTNLVPSQTPHPDPSGGGGDPLVDWPSATVTQYLSALGATQDSLPSIQHQNITEYTFTPDLASVDDVFMITCANGGSLSATYEGLLGEAHFEYDNSESWYVSPHQEFAVTYSTDGLDNFNIFVYKLMAATPEPAASYLTAKASFENATGIGLPTINNLDADYTYSSSEHWYEFRTDSGAPLGTFEVFESYFDDNLPSGWAKGALEESANAKRYLYSHTNGDSIELYFATDDNYIVVTYSEYVGGGGGGGGAEVIEAAYPSMYQLQTDDPYFTKIYKVTDPSADVEWVHEESSGTIGPNITENCEVIYPTSEDDFLIRYRFSCDVAVKDKNFFFSVNGSRIYPIVDESIDEISAYNNFDVVYDETEEEVLLIAQENIIDAVTYLTVYFDHYEAAQVAESAHTVHHVNEPSGSITGFPPGEGNTYCAIWTFVEYGEWTGNWNRPEDGDPGFVRSTLKVFFRVTFNNNGTLTLESGDPDTMEASATWSNVPYTQVEGGYEFTINLADASADYYTQMMFQYYASSSSYTGIAQPCSGNRLGGMDGIAQLYKEINYNVWYQLWQDLNS